MKKDSKESNYENDMYIDETALDVEFLEQPSLVVKYSRLLAEARQERDLLKEALDLKKAEINLDIRDDPGKYNLEKITVDAVEACILMEDDYITAQKEYNNARFEVDLLQGVLNALEHRKSALENLVRLYGQEYFAGPTIPHDLTQARKERGAAISHKIGQSMKRTVKQK
jgi:hypothetical protein